MRTKRSSEIMRRSFASIAHRTHATVISYIPLCSAVEEEPEKDNKKEKEKGKEKDATKKADDPKKKQK